jgi:eukaryotic-like serine/threonine-protein kinase
VIGSRLGRYHIIDRLGAGGMGVVYRAYDERLQREVALKLLPAGLLADDLARRRFRREALALSQLSHPNIEGVHDLCHEDGVDFLVLELVPGTGLDALVAERGPLPEPDVLRLGAQLAAGLQAAHEHGVVHRDLKPANLHVTPEGALKILDFGLAKLMHGSGGPGAATSLTGGHELAGTLPYMAPEQLDGRPVDARTDVYGAGAVLYELATGKRAHPGDDAAALLYRILNTAPAPPESVNPSLSPALAALIRRAMERDPARRFSTARDLQAALEAAAGPGGARAPRGEGRRPAWLVPALGAVALVLALAAGLEWSGLRRRMAGGTETIASLAVLPLENLSRDPGQEYFVDGMTDELITELAQLGSPRVISRTSVMRYKGARKSLREIARELHVDAVVEGSVLRAGERVRISAQLVRASNQQDLWAARYERDLRDVLALQGEVARAIVRGVRTTLTPRQQSRLVAGPAVEPAAYEEYLRGRYSFNKFTGPGFREAVRHYQRAIQLQPDYARAYAGMAFGWYGLSNIYLPPAEAMPRSRDAALRAIALDDGVAEAHAALGVEKTVYEWDWAGAERELRRSLELNPGDASTHLWYAQYLVTAGRAQEAIAEGKRCLELNPLDLLANATVGWHLYYVREYDRSVAQLRSVVAMDSTFYMAHAFLGLTYLAMDRPGDAVRELERAKAYDDNPEDNAQLACAYARAGRAADARRLLRELDRRAAREFVPAYDLVAVHLALGERARALDLLEQAARDKAELLIYVAVDPLLDPLRDEPRFRALVARMGLAARAPARREG